MRFGIKVPGKSRHAKMRTELSRGSRSTAGNLIMEVFVFDYFHIIAKKIYR